MEKEVNNYVCFNNVKQKPHPWLYRAGDLSGMEPEEWEPGMCPNDVGRGSWSLEDMAA